MKNVLLCCFILLSYCNLQAQGLSDPDYYKNITPMSPTAASLGTYGETPVSLYSGSSSVPIPLYQLKGKELSIPVSLNYNASGIRVEDNGSWVGLGWSLEAGGVITQTVKGKQEFKAPSPQRLGTSPLLYSTPAQRKTTFETLQNIPIGTKDFEADVFNYNFMGYSGSFVFDASGKAFFSKHENFKVDFQTDGFKLTSDKGVQYEFKALEYSTPEYPTEPSGPSAYYLTKITSASGVETIIFEYENESFTYSQPIRKTKSLRSLGTNNQFQLLSETPNRSNRMFINGKRLSKITFVNLGTIEFGKSTNPRVDLGFYGDTKNVYSLESVTFKNLAGTVVKKFKLEYENVQTNELYKGPFTACPSPSCPNLDQYSEHLNYRMYLKKVYEQANDNSSTLNPYEFEYYGRLANGKDMLPHKMSGNQDHWGFFNGRNNGLNLWPGFCGPYGTADPTFGIELFCYMSGVPSLAHWEVSSANRDPNPDVVNAGSLKKIKYPTNGLTEFIYESNTFSSIGNPRLNIPSLRDCSTNQIISIGGGIRIKEIKDFDNSTLIKAKEYFYNNGNLKNRPFYHNYFTLLSCDKGRSYVYQDCSSACGGPNDSPVYVEINSGSVNDVGYRGGPLVGYEEVIEKSYAIENGNNKYYNGSITYNYLTQNNDQSLPETFGGSLKYIGFVSTNNYLIAEKFLDSDLVYPYAPIDNLDWYHGQLLKKTIKNQTNDTIVESTYEYDNTIISEISSTKVFQIRTDLDYHFLNYKFTSGSPKLIKQIEKRFN